MLPVPPVPTEPATLLAWAARVRECSELSAQLALTLRWRVDRRGLTGPAGDALAGLGVMVAARLGVLAAESGAAAQALVRAAHEAAVAGEAAVAHEAAVAREAAVAGEALVAREAAAR